MKNIFLIVTLVAVALAGCNSKPIRGDEGYPLPWKKLTGSEKDLFKECLYKHGIGSCQELYVRNSSSEAGNYLLGCTSDGKHWDACYFVNMEQHTVIGLKPALPLDPPQ